MSLSRRRFLAISASVLAAPAALADQAVTWRGRALGADVMLRVDGLEVAAGARLWRRVERVLEQVEARFSLFRRSELVRLNETGILAHPSAEMRGLMALCARLNGATNGAFDPTVQAIWQALAEGRDAGPARTAAGWTGVDLAEDRIRLAPGMALTFNGIAQGHAADRIAAVMRAEGFGNVMIDAGEILALGQGGDGRPWRAGIAAPDGALVARCKLSDRALATSSPGATRVGPSRSAHILHPDGRRALWGTVSVSAPDAALADGLSTAFCLMDRQEIDAALRVFPAAKLEYLG